MAQTEEFMFQNLAFRPTVFNWVKRHENYYQNICRVRAPERTIAITETNKTSYESRDPKTFWC
jgi:hypothetical protein